MVKGISRQVIVVRSPDPKLFEQAIFILREDALGKGGMSDRAILRQAQQAAGSYIPAGKRRAFRLGSLVSVSYTHLAVNKRQLLARLVSMG